MLHRIYIYIYILAFSGFLVLFGNTAAIPEIGPPLVSDLVRVRGANNSSLNAKRDPTVIVEQLEQEGQRLAINLRLQGVDYLLHLDTGGGLTWIATSDFTCYDDKHQRQTQEYCKLGPDLYKGSVTSTEYFKEHYGSTEVARGKRSRKTVEIGGEEVEDVEIGFAHELVWQGDGLTVGLFGLAWYPGATSIWQDLCKAMCLPVQYTLALNREADGDYNGGAIAFGGTVDGQPITPDAWATVDLVWTDAGKWLINGFKMAFNGPKAVQTEKIDQITIIDSGDPRIRLPEETTNAFLAAWDPDPKWHEQKKVWEVSCKARWPDSVTFEIGGKKFKVPVRDNIAAEYQGFCYLTIVKTAKTGDNASLGLPFMRYLVINHDFEGRKMSFKQRVYA
ncbi:aspartic peptidase domain-containing protein [Massariosphaeria phaeospora]|uniref:Aspartic peptidase domain-containing protein n=1 Tax=Massariosphaeria phaeospora TaxID=100035 RepID=A0A7C8I1F0_9PLEO|nr:aspartic peptidase domain-containing protein [Massariosphaeria phaeospora]